MSSQFNKLFVHFSSESNLRFELGYSNSFADSIARVLNTYTTRPAVAEWEAWRDANAIEEINAWADFIDFWMSGMYPIFFLTRSSIFLLNILFLLGNFEKVELYPVLPLLTKIA